MRVMTVDDDEAVRLLLSKLLHAEGHEVAQAASGRQALAMLDEFEPDVMLLDLMMPHMTGLAVTHQIRSMPRWKDLPIVMVTAYEDPIHRQEAEELGIEYFIIKPFDPVDLVGIVAELGPQQKAAAVHPGAAS